MKRLNLQMVCRLTASKLSAKQKSRSVMLRLTVPVRLKIYLKRSPPGKPRSEPLIRRCSTSA